MTDDADTGRVTPELTDHRRVMLEHDGMGADVIAHVDLSVEAYDTDDAVDLHDTIVEAIAEAVGAENVDAKRGGLQ